MISQLEFGNFTSICKEVFVPPCILWKADTINGTQTFTKSTCNMGAISIGSTRIEGFGELLISVIGVVLMLIIIYRTHKKYAAVGRKEMNILFSFFCIICLLQILSLSNLLDVATRQIVSAVHIGFIVGFFWVLLLNGIVGYQLVEDGSAISFYGILLSGLAWVTIGTLFAMDAAQNILGAGTSTAVNQSMALFGVYFILPLVAVLGFVILETVLVAKNLGDQKPLINLYVSLVFFILSMVMMFVLNTTTCTGTKKAVNGHIFSVLLNLGAIIFIYRFWDSITEDDWDNIDDIFV